MAEEKTDPYQVIRNFCQSYHPTEVQALLWEWFETAISRNNSVYDDAKERSTLILLYENINRLVAAAYVVHKKSPKQTTRKDNPKNKKPGADKP